MKKRLLSMFLAAAMVFTAATAAYVPAEAATEPKVAVTVADAKGTEAATVTVDGNYVVKANFTDAKLDTSAVKVNLKMTDIAGLGIEGTREANMSVKTDLGANAAISEYVNYNLFNKATVVTTFNGKTFDYAVDRKDTTITATPADEAAVRAAWQAFAGYVDTTETANEDSYVAIPDGAYVTIGTEKALVEKDLVMNDVNNRGNLADAIVDAVKYEVVEAGKDQVVAFIPEGTTVKVGASVAELSEDLTVTVNGFDAKDLEGCSLKAVKEAAATRKEDVLAAELVKIVNAVIVAAEGQTITINAKTTDYALADAEAKVEAAQKELEEAKKALEEAKAEAKAEAEAAVKAAEEKLALAKNALAIGSKKVQTLKAKGTHGKLKITWSEVPEATEYKLTIIRNGKVWKKDIRTTETSYTVKKAGGYKYKVKLTPVAEFDGEEYFGKTKSVTRQVKIVMQAISVKKSGEKAVVITMKAAKATGYEIQIATNKKFKNARTITVKTSKKLNKKVTISEGKNYIRVRAYRTANKITVKGNWSNTESVKR